MGIFTAAEVRFTATGAAQTEQAAKRVAGAVDETGKASTRAAAGMKAAQASSMSLGQAFSAVTSGVGKVTFGVTALSSVIGLALGGGLSGAVGGLITAFKGLVDILGDIPGETKRAAEAADHHAEALKRIETNAKAAAEAMRDLNARRLAQSAAAESGFAGDVGAPLSSFTLAGRLDLRAQGRERARAMEAMEAIVAKAETATAAELADLMDRYEDNQRILERGAARMAVPSAAKAGGGRRESQRFAGPVQGPSEEHGDWSRAGALAMHAGSGNDYMAAVEAQQAIADELDHLALDTKFQDTGLAAKEMGEMASSGLHMMTDAMGAAVAQSIIFGDSIGKGAKRAAADTLAALSTQALQQSLYLLAAAPAASVLFPGVGTAAVLSAAGALAAFGVGAGLVARGLGASQGGGGGGGGGRGGGGDRTDRHAIDGGRGRDDGPKEVNYYLNFSGQQLSTDRDIGEAVRRVLGSTSSMRGMTPLPAR